MPAVMVTMPQFMAFKPTSRKIFSYTYVPRLPHFVALKHAAERPSLMLQFVTQTVTSVRPYCLFYRLQAF
jgi:hypothetical protein